MNKAPPSSPNGNSPAVADFNLEEFVNYGMDELVYVEEISHRQALRLFPDLADMQNEELADQGPYFVIKAANGMPIILANDLHEAVDTAQDHDLKVLKLH